VAGVVLLGAFVVGGWVTGASVVAIVVAIVVGVAVVGVVFEAAGRVVVTASVATVAGSVAGVDESDDEQLTTNRPRAHVARIFLMR
jgi:hypothetical protein